MTYIELAYLHLGTVVPAFFIASYLLIKGKGTVRHRLLGKIYMVLMLITAFVTLFMPARVGPTLFYHFGLIHLFSVLVLYLVPSAYVAIRNGDVNKHKSKMVGLYIGGLLVAGSFAFMPGRLLHSLLFV